MGKVLSVAVQKANRFNVESRAQKVIARDKPTPAPKYDYNLKEIEQVKKAFPNLEETLEKKDSDLDDRLKQVFVTSTDSIREIDSRYNPEKPLPLNRKPTEEFELGFKETGETELQKGYISLRQAIQFIADHQSNPNEWSAERIAKDFRLDRTTTDNILEHFKTFQIHISQANNKKQNVLIQTMREKGLLEGAEAPEAKVDENVIEKEKRN